MMLRAAALSFAVLVASGCTTADAKPDASNPDFTCTFTHPSKSATSLKRMPSPIRKYIRDKIGPMADRGKFFNAGDVVTKPAPFNRFIRGGTIGERWFLWYEHGGFAYWKDIVLFGSDPSGTPHVIAEKHGGANLCADTDAMLDAAVKGSP